MIHLSLSTYDSLFVSLFFVRAFGPMWAQETRWERRGGGAHPLYCRIKLDIRMVRGRGLAGAEKHPPHRGN